MYVVCKYGMSPKINMMPKLWQQEIYGCDSCVCDSASVGEPIKLKFTKTMKGYKLCIIYICIYVCDPISNASVNLSTVYILHRYTTIYLCMHRYTFMIIYSCTAQCSEAPGQQVLFAICTSIIPVGESIKLFVQRPWVLLACDRNKRLSCHDSLKWWTVKRETGSCNTPLIHWGLGLQIWKPPRIPTLKSLHRKSEKPTKGQSQQQRKLVPGGEWFHRRPILLFGTVTRLLRFWHTAKQGPAVEITLDGMTSEVSNWLGSFFYCRLYVTLDTAPVLSRTSVE